MEERGVSDDSSGSGGEEDVKVADMSTKIGSGLMSNQPGRKFNSLDSLRGSPTMRPFNSVDSMRDSILLLPTPGGSYRS